jgi:hypothetical protein
MQPPDAEPTTSPLSRAVSIAPSGRRDEPHVFTTVTISACWTSGPQGPRTLSMIFPFFVPSYHHAIAAPQLLKM